MGDEIFDLKERSLDKVEYVSHDREDHVNVTNIHITYDEEGDRSDNFLPNDMVYVLIDLNI